MLQDALLALNVVIILAALAGATTTGGGARHVLAHALFCAAAAVLPFACFDLSRGFDAVPLQAWLFAAFYFTGHVANTAFHVARPAANHSLGPEVLVQTTVVAWGGSLLASLDASVWHRGQVGLITFALSSVFVAMIVLMVFYQSELAAHPRDDVDLRRGPLRGKSNAALLCCGPTALLLTLFLATRDLRLLGAAVGSWVLIRLLVRPLPRAWTPTP